MIKVLTLCKGSNLLTKYIEYLSILVLFGVRLYLFDIFFWSGWQKMTSWASTLMLFQYEYKVLWMSPEVAAFLGVAGELIFPVLLILGFGARFPAIALFVVNGISILFYPTLFQPEYACALKDHLLWGVLIAWIIFQGHGKLSLDYLLQRKFCKEYKI